MSSNSSCASPENAAAGDMDFLESMMLPGSEQYIYQQILDIDGSDLLMQQQQQQQQQQNYHLYSVQQQQQQQQKQQQHQQLQYGIGLGTPPTSPPALSFPKFLGNQSEIGTMYYSQPQAIQNVYVIPEQPVSQLLPQQQQQQNPLQQSQPVTPPSSLQQLTEEQLTYLMLMQQLDNPESSSLFSPSPTTSCSSSLSNSPFAESPLMPDFDLFPVGYPSAPVMAPSAAVQSIYGQTPGEMFQMTPPMHQMDLEREVSSLFKHDAFQTGAVAATTIEQQQPMTTEMSLLCKCPGKFPCGELPADALEDNNNTTLNALHCGSPLQDIREIEYSESDSLSSEEEQEDENELDPTYSPSPRARSNTTGAISGPKSSSSNATKARSKSMIISTTGSPYHSPYAKDLPSPKTVRHDRRRSGSYSTTGGHSHHHQLLDPENVPEIKDIHVCPVCQRRFTRPFNLRSHLMTHTTARPFPCDECHWKFTRQHDLLRHKRAKHPNSVTNTSTVAGQKKDAKSRPVSSAA
ncbi:hypothetical protein BGX34_002503 [Mortierella sp. NVP85]|nr:hypothetical protein BGX34_002503 [Mortierella sp. NVP85]